MDVGSQGGVEAGLLQGCVRPYLYKQSESPQISTAILGAQSHIVSPRLLTRLPSWDLHIVLDDLLHTQFRVPQSIWSTLCLGLMCAGTHLGLRRGLLKWFYQPLVVPGISGHVKAGTQMIGSLSHAAQS